MSLRNAFGALGLDATLQAIRDRLPAALSGGRFVVDGSTVVQPVSDNGGSLSVDDGGGSLTVDGIFWQATQPVSGPLTDGQLRAAAVPVSMAAVPTGAATEATLSALNTKIPASPATEGGNLATITGRTPALGAAAAAASSPVAISTETVSGTITTQNLVPNGVATAGSAVEISLLGALSLAIQTTGTYTGALSIQLTNDNSRWETVTVAQIINAITGVGAATIASAAVGVFTFNALGFARARVTALAAVTGTATISLRSSLAAPAVTASQPTAANLNATVAGTVTANIGTGSVAAGTNAIGDVGTQYRASATGAASAVNVLSPATPIGQTVKGSAGRLLGFTVSNTNAAVRWLKIFNATVVTPGTTAATYEFAIPAGQTVTFNMEGGIGFATGIMVMVTAAQGLTNNGAVAGNEVNGIIAFA